jgi:hypothetical protein
MVSWGDVNQILNRLVAEGIIRSFWTNLGAPLSPLGVHVVVVPAAPVDEIGAGGLRERIGRELGPLAVPLTITVDRSGPA